MVAPADERRHEPPGADPDWCESWYFDFARADGSLGGFARLVLFPNRRRCWWWGYVAGADRPTVAVRDHDVPLPRTKALEIRTEGLWAELICETPLEHWSVGMEAYGVAYDDPDEAFGAERGDRVAVGFDLEWVLDAPPDPNAGGYSQRCTVSGEVLVGTEVIELDDVPGTRSHTWGVQPWDAGARRGDVEPLAYGNVRIGDVRLTRALTRAGWVEWV